MNLKTNLIKLLASGFGCGYAPFAPGSVGSLLGLGLGGWLFFINDKLDNYLTQSLSIVIIIAIISILSLLAVVIIKQAEKIFNEHDSSIIVIDECIGQAIVVMFFVPTLTNMLVGFLLFRVFDILKPWPISFIDQNLNNAWGTLLDDIAAAIFATALMIIML